MRKKMHIFFRKKNAIIRRHPNLLGVVCSLLILGSFFYFEKFEKLYGVVFAASQEILVTIPTSDVSDNFLFSGGNNNATEVIGTGSDESVQLIFGQHWKKISNPPSAQFNGAIATENNDIYQVAGSVNKYDFNSNIWNYNGDFPYGYSWDGGIYSENGIAYIIAGGVLYRFNTTQAFNLEYVSNYSGSTFKAMAYDGLDGIYILGEWGDIARYNILQNTWDAITSYAGIGSGTWPVRSMYVDEQGNIYVLEGYGTPYLWKYDMSLNSWDKVADAPEALYSPYSTHDGAGHMYVIGGGGPDQGKNFLKYDIVADSWSTVGEIPNVADYNYYYGILLSGQNNYIYAMPSDGSTDVFQFSLLDDRYATSGSWESSIINLGTNEGWKSGDSFSAQMDLPASTSVDFYIKSATTLNDLNAATYNQLGEFTFNSVDGVLTADLVNNGFGLNDSFFQIKAELRTSDYSVTPKINSINFKYWSSDVIAPEIGSENLNLEMIGRDGEGNDKKINNGGWTAGSQRFGFSWDKASDVELNTKGYCLYFGTDPAGDPVSNSGLLKESSLISNPYYSWWIGALPQELIDPQEINENCKFILKDSGEDRTDFDMYALAMQYSMRDQQGNDLWSIPSDSEPYYLNVKAIDNYNNVSTDFAQFEIGVDESRPNLMSSVNAPTDFISSKDFTISWPEVGSVDGADDIACINSAWDGLSDDGNYDDDGCACKEYDENESCVSWWYSEISGVAGYQYGIVTRIDNRNGVTWYGPNHTNAPDDFFPASETSYTMQNAFLDENGNPMMGRDGNLGEFPIQGSMEFWMKTNTTSGSHDVLSTRDNGDMYNELHFKQDGGSFYACVSDVTGYGDCFDFFPDGDLSVDTWHHLAFTWDQDENLAIGYLNGEEIFSRDVYSWPNVIPNFIVGRGEYDTGRYWDGSIDEIAMYNRNLTSEEIFTQYDVEGYMEGDTYQSVIQRSSNLVHYWKFDGNLVDSVGNADGEIVLGNITFFEDPLAWFSSNAATFDNASYAKFGQQIVLSDFANLNEGTNYIRIKVCDNAGNCDDNSQSTAMVRIAAGSTGRPRNLSVSPADSTSNAYSFSWSLPEDFPGKNYDPNGDELSYCYTVNTLPSAQTCTFTEKSDCAEGLCSLDADAFATRPGENTFYVATRYISDSVDIIDYNDYNSISFNYSGSAPGIVEGVDISDVSIKDAQDWKLAIFWNQPSEIGAGVSKYEIFRGENRSSCDSFEEIGFTEGLAYIDPDLEQKDYYYCVRACDSANNCGAYSSLVTEFPTGKFTEPAILTSGPDISEISTSKATIDWTTDRESDSRVAFGTKSREYLVEEPSKPDQVSDHNIVLNDLSPGTKYYFEAKWMDEDGNIGVAKQKSFQTKPTPSVKDVKALQVGISNSLIHFTAENANKALIYYGKTTAFGSSKEVVTNEEEGTYDVQLEDLEDDTKYYYKINTFDSEGREYEGTTVDFTTIPRPKVFDVKVQQVMNAAVPTVSVFWNSNVEVLSVVSFYPEGNIEEIRKEVSVDFIAGSHEMIVGDLKEDTQYVWIVSGTDRSGNEVISDSYVFNTSEDARPPQISDLTVEGSNTAINNGSENEQNISQLLVSWTTDELATSQVEFGEGTEANYPQKTQEDSNLTYNHMVAISGLTPSRVYHLRAISKDKAGNVGNSFDSISITPKEIDSAFALVVANLQQAFGFFGN
ncbi:MAG: cytochrome c family protein [uncultured bacterium]|nr:MAG: cytochrome c family protein [uncultured bacterium]